MVAIKETDSDSKKQTNSDSNKQTDSNSKKQTNSDSKKQTESDNFDDVLLEHQQQLEQVTLSDHQDDTVGSPQLSSLDTTDVNFDKIDIAFCHVAGNTASEINIAAVGSSLVLKDHLIAQASEAMGLSWVWRDGQLFPVQSPLRFCYMKRAAVNLISATSTFLDLQTAAQSLDSSLDQDVLFVSSLELTKAQQDVHDVARLRLQ